MPEVAFIWLVVFAAVLLQSLVGFGSAMVAMALLAGRLGLPVASPLMALIAATLEAVLLARYRQALDPGAIWRLLAGALVGVPLGLWALGRLPEALMLGALGLLIAGYAVYSLLGRRPPALHHPGWAFGAGALAGLLSGAYNTGGPPVIVYGDGRRWSPEEFKGNLQSFFLFNDGLVLIGHALAGNLTAVVWGHYLAAAPAIALGLAAGLLLERRLPAGAFRRAALAALLALGARLLWSALGI